MVNQSEYTQQHQPQGTVDGNHHRQHHHQHQQQQQQQQQQQEQAAAAARQQQKQRNIALVAKLLASMVTSGYYFSHLAAEYHPPEAIVAEVGEAMAAEEESKRARREAKATHQQQRQLNVAATHRGRATTANADGVASSSPSTGEINNLEQNSNNNINNNINNNTRNAIPTLSSSSHHSPTSFGGSDDSAPTGAAAATITPITNAAIASRCNTISHPTISSDTNVNNTNNANNSNSPPATPTTATTTVATSRTITTSNNSGYTATSTLMSTPYESEGADDDSHQEGGADVETSSNLGGRAAEGKGGNGSAATTASSSIESSSSSSLSSTNSDGDGDGSAADVDTGSATPAPMTTTTCCASTPSFKKAPPTAVADNNNAADGEKANGGQAKRSVGRAVPMAKGSSAAAAEDVASSDHLHGLTTTSPTQRRRAIVSQCVANHPATTILNALKRPSDLEAQSKARALPIVLCPFFGTQRIRCLNQQEALQQQQQQQATAVPGADSTNTNNNNNNNGNSIASVGGDGGSGGTAAMGPHSKSILEVARRSTNGETARLTTDPFTAALLRAHLLPAFLPLYASQVPTVPITQFIEHLLMHFGCGVEGFVMAFCLLAKLPPNYVPLCDRSVHRMVLTALVLSFKLLSDQRVAMRVFATIGGVTKEDMIAMEWAFLTGIGFDASVPTAMYIDMVFSLRQHCSTLSHHAREAWAADAWRAVIEGMPVPSGSLLKSELKSIVVAAIGDAIKNNSNNNNNTTTTNHNSTIVVKKGEASTEEEGMLLTQKEKERAVKAAAAHHHERSQKKVIQMDDAADYDDDDGMSGGDALSRLLLVRKEEPLMVHDGTAMTAVPPPPLPMTNSRSVLLAAAAAAAAGAVEVPAVGCQ